MQRDVAAFACGDRVAPGRQIVELIPPLRIASSPFAPGEVPPKRDELALCAAAVRCRRRGRGLAESRCHLWRQPRSRAAGWRPRPADACPPAFARVHGGGDRSTTTRIPDNPKTRGMVRPRVLKGVDRRTPARLDTDSPSSACEKGPFPFLPIARRAFGPRPADRNSESR